MHRVLASKNFALFCNQVTEGTTTTLSSSKLGQDAIKAVWAQAIFDQIRNASLRDQNERTTLVDHLRSYRLPTQSLNSLNSLARDPKDIEKVRQELMKTFDPLSGVELPSLIFESQERFIDGSIVRSSNKLAFFPNTFVTVPIFQILSHKFSKPKKYMTIGKQGISKSMSLLLAWHLSTLTTNFRFKHPSMVADLVKKNLLKASFPKIFYISFRASDNNLQDYVQLLKTQCPEFETHEMFDDFIKAPYTVLGLRNVISDMRQQYKNKNIRCLVVMDQVNTLAKRFHDCNQIIRKEASKGITKDPNSSQFLLPHQEMQFFNSFKDKFDLLLNSSSNIEEYLLYERRPANFAYFTLNMNHHSDMKIHRCIYDRKNPLSKKEIYRFIWHQCSRFMTPFEESLLEEYFKDICDGLAAGCKELCSLMTPLSINKAISQFVPLQKLRGQIKQFQQELSGVVIAAAKPSGEPRLTGFIKGWFQTKESSKKTPENIPEKIPENISEKTKNFMNRLLTKLGLEQAQVHLYQKIREFAEREAKQQSISPIKKEILQNMQKIAKQKIQFFNITDLNAKARSKAQKFQNQDLLSHQGQDDKQQLSEAELEERKKQKIKRFVETQFQSQEQEHQFHVLSEAIEVCSRMESKNYKNLQVLKSFMMEAVRNENIIEKERIFFMRLREFIEEQKYFSELSKDLDIKNLQKSITEFAETWKKSNPEEKNEKMETFIKSLFKLPRLRYNLKNSVQSLVQSIQIAIEKQGRDLVLNKTLSFLAASKNTLDGDYKYMIALNSAAYFQQYGHAPGFIGIPFEALENYTENTITNNYNKDLFDLDLKNKVLTLKVSKRELSAASVSWIFEYIGFPSDLFKHEGATAGLLIQHYLIFWLRNNQACTLKFGSFKFLIEGFKNFVHFYSQKQKKNMKQNLKDMLQVAQKKTVYCLGRPITAKQLKQGGDLAETKTSPNSPKFDLLAILDKFNNLQIITIDLTVNQKKEQIESKRQGAASLIKLLLRYNYQNAKWDPAKVLKISQWLHIVACKEQLVSKKPIQVLWDYENHFHKIQQEKCQQNIAQAKNLEKIAQQIKVKSQRQNIIKQAKDKIKKFQDKLKNQNKSWQQFKAAANQLQNLSTTTRIYVTSTNITQIQLTSSKQQSLPSQIARKRFKDLLENLNKNKVRPN